MRIRPSRWAAVGGALLICLAVSSAAVRAAVTIEQVLPFATRKEVRVQVAVTSDQPGAVDLEGKIVPASGGGTALWEGSLGRATLREGRGVGGQTVKDLKPRLWSPGSPTLYHLTVVARQGEQVVGSETVRFGFRSVSVTDAQVHLNGKPIFLKGIAINPPERDVPDEVAYSRAFAHDYVRYLRSQNVNLIRMNFPFKVDPRCQVWFDACDELGMMVYQGNYGGPPGATSRGPGVDPEEQTSIFEGKDPKAPPTSKSAPPKGFEGSLASYKEVFSTYVRHPSVIIYVLTNEVPGPVRSKPEWHEFLTKIDARINEWDPTRLVIGNAGYGLGGEGDINDVHRYWGWYYNSFLTYYNLRDSVKLFGESTDRQPLTFSECVGSFTSPLGTFNLIFRKQLAPQLGWTGHAGEQKELGEQYQAFMVKRALESFRTMREQNPRMAGLMPFTILFYNWEGIKSFADMKPKPAMLQMGVSYQPILASIELWTGQVYAGTRIRPIVHVVNDAEDFSDLTGAKLTVEVAGKGGKAAVTKTVELPKISYYESRPVPVELTLPETLSTGNYVVSAAVERGGKVVARNQEGLYVAEPLMRTMGGPEVAVYDPQGTTTKALGKLGFVTQPVKSMAKAPEAKWLIVGQEAVKKGTSLAALSAYVRGGGRVLVLAQDGEAFDTSWLPAKVTMLDGTATDPTYTPKVRPTAAQSHVNPERPWHPVFAGVERAHLRLWSDYTDWNQSKKEFPRVFPVTHGFKLGDAKDLGKVAILADYDRGLEGVALAELFDGQGSVILTGLDLVPRIGLDPIADRLLANLVSYLTSSDHSDTQPLIERPIVWGNYPTERGVLTGPLHGLVYNCRWVPPPTAPNAKPLPDNTGAWNTKPGNPFVAVGVRPFGPYTWSTGASPREGSADPVGTGVFHCRVPSGRRTVVTKVENPGKDPQRLEVSVNGTAGTPATVAPGKTITVRTPIPAGAAQLGVRYTGGKQLVILETSFE